MSSPRNEPEEHDASSPGGDQNDEDAGGLFGSGSEDGDSDIQRRSPKRRKLEDSELDSGDDEGRNDRANNGEDEDEDVGPGKMAIVAEVSIAKHPGPLPSDDELYLLAFPPNITLNQRAFTLESFEPPAPGADLSNSKFSALSASNNTIRWRQSPNSPASNQSNARINRWSNGSLTLQLASNPLEQIELTAQARAQPQINPARPTPTSIKARSGDKIPNAQSTNWHMYLACPHEGAGMIRNSTHITTQLSVQSTDQMDDAVMKLQQNLAASGRGGKTGVDKGPQLINVDEDPEKARRQAELAEKEKAKMQRRYQNQLDRENNRNGNVLKRSGLRQGGIGGGLTVGGLEGDDDLSTTKRGLGAAKSKKSRRRNDEYSDDEDDYRGRRRTKEDEYDEDDGFLVDDDEEPELVASSEEEAEDDLDAEGEEDDEVQAEASKPTSKVEDTGGAGGRKRGRRVVEDDDE